MKNYRKVNYDVVARLKATFNVDLIGYVNIRREGRNVIVCTQAHDSMGHIYEYKFTPEGRATFEGYYEAFGDGTLYPVTYDPIKDCYKL